MTKCGITNDGTQDQAGEGDGDIENYSRFNLDAHRGRGAYMSSKTLPEA